jgi:hypothetical protein
MNDISPAQSYDYNAQDSFFLYSETEHCVNKFKVLFVCNPEDVWPSNFGECLKMPQR